MGKTSPWFRDGGPEGGCKPESHFLNLVTVDGSVDRKWQEVAGLGTENKPILRPVLPSRKSKNAVAQVEPPCILYIESLCCVSVWVSACLSEEQDKISKNFYLKPATPVAFPLPSQKGEAATQKLARQMTVELSHPVIWESLPMFVPPWDPQRSHHAPTCPSSTLCQLPPCQGGTSESSSPLPKGWTVWFPTMQFFIAAFELEMWYSYPFQAHIRAVQLRPMSTCHPWLCHQGRAKAAYTAMPSSGSLTLCDQPACRVPCGAESCFKFLFYPRWAL